MTATVIRKRSQSLYNKAMIINADRLKALWPWLAQARYAGLAAAVIFIALWTCVTVVSLHIYEIEPVVRWTGLVLQMLGLGTVYLGHS